jgi:O-antigen/teichoic acid export membrane protein
MSEARETRRTGVNIIVNWAAVASGFLVMYFLSPFVVHHLGTAAYGAWTLLVSLTSYMALMDLGMRGAVTRFTARHHAAGDHEASSEAVSAALWFRQWISLLLLVAAVILAYFLDTLGVPAELLEEARYALIVNTITVGVVLVAGVFAAVLAGMNNYTVMSGAAVLQTLLRAAGTIVVLGAGYSLVALAFVELAAAIVAEAIVVVSCLRAYPELRLRLRMPHHRVLHQMATFSGSMMLVQMFARAAQYGQTLIIGAFLSITGVAYFAIGQTLADSVRQILLTTGPVFMTTASRFDATGRENSLRSLLGTGTRLTLFIILPVLMTLFVRGETFIALWMGPEYAAQSGEVLRILVVGMFFLAGTNTAYNVLFGMGFLRPAIVCTGIEAAATVVLSIVAAQYYGLAGVAWATSGPIVVVRTLLWPGYVCAALKIRLVDYVRDGWIRPILAVTPLAAVSVFIEQQWVATSLGVFFLQVAAAMLVYFVSSAVFLWPDVRNARLIVWPRVPESDAAALPRIA